MRDVSAALAETLTGSRQVHSTLAVYYNGAPVLDAVPVTDGTLELDATQDVAGTLNASVPRYLTSADGNRLDLMPRDSSSLLSSNGTRLALSYYVGRPGATPEAVALGWFRIAEWAEGDGVVTLTAPTLESVVQEARFLTARTIGKGAAFSAAFRSLLGGLLPLRFAVDQAKVAAAQTFEDDRLAALKALATAWPARLFVDDSGTLVVAPPYDDDADPVVLTLTDGEDGTVVQAPRSGSRVGVYNAVRASGESTGDTAPVSAVAYLNSGPYRWNGPFGNVPYFYSSPLLTTVAQCLAAARTRLANLQAVAEPVTIECAPDPRVQVGDVIELRQDTETRRLRVDAVNLPLTYAATMTITTHETGTSTEAEG